MKGAVSSARGTVNEGVGKLTGDRTLETKGKVQKVQGTSQDRMGAWAGVEVNKGGHD